MGRRYDDDDGRTVVIRERPGCFGGCLGGCAGAGAVIAAVAVGLGVLMLPAIHSARQAARKTAGGRADPPIPAPVPDSTPTLHAGDEAEIWVAGGEGTWLSDDDSWDALLAAENARDVEEIALLMARGKVIREENGTRVKVLKPALLSTRVRIREGANPGFEGWIPRGLIRPAGGAR